MGRFFTLKKSQAMAVGSPSFWETNFAAKSTLTLRLTLRMLQLHFQSKGGLAKDGARRDGRFNGRHRLTGP